MSKSRNKLLNMLDREIRNVKIVTTFYVLGKFTKMKYDEKIKLLGMDYFLSAKAIEKIINEAKKYD